MSKVVSVNRKLKNSIIILSVVLGSIIIALSVMLTIFIAKTTTYKLQLENNYKRNFYELISDINSLEIDLSKLIATNSLKSQKELLTNIYDISKTSSVNLSALPIANQKIKNLNGYLNTIGGYSYSLLEKNLNSNLKITDDELKTIEGIYDYCVKIKYDLNNYISEVENLDIVSLIDFSNGDISDFDGGLSDVNDNNEELPTLIYDGPFSDSVVNREIKGLESVIYSEEQVREKLKSNFKFFDEFNIEYVGETLGKFATYNYYVKSGDVSLYVQITKQGAFLLSVNSLEVPKGEKDLSVEECEVFAHNFASLMGIDNMHAVWSQKVNNIVYVNLAPIIEHVIYYPDLIKVKVDSSAGFVVGWEASNYAYNHVERDIFSPAISFNNAQNLLSSALKVEERNYCIIPNKYVGETYAYEFICSWNDFIYYIYLDINTGEELNIMRVVNTTNGDLLF